MGFFFPFSKPYSRTCHVCSLLSKIYLQGGDICVSSQKSLVGLGWPISSLLSKVFNPRCNVCFSLFSKLWSKQPMDFFFPSFQYQLQYLQFLLPFRPQRYKRTRHVCFSSQNVPADPLWVFSSLLSKFALEEIISASLLSKIHLLTANVCVSSSNVLAGTSWVLSSLLSEIVFERNDVCFSSVQNPLTSWAMSASLSVQSRARTAYVFFSLLCRDYTYGTALKPLYIYSS